MSISAELLRELHRLHRQATDLRDRLTKGPKQVKVRKSNVEHLAGRLEESQEKLKRTKLTVSEKELTLRERENRILDVRAKLNSCSSNKEYQAFMEQIAADEQANSVLSDEILELFDKASEDEAVVEEMRKALEEGKTQLAELTEKVQLARDGLESELSRVSNELRKCEKSLPIDLKQDYDRVVKAHGEEAMAPLEGDVCGGCYQKVTAQMQNELQLSRMVFCKSCGRLLYLPEDTSVT